MNSPHPDVWKDDKRMAVLFSPFRNKNLNPQSWEQKMSFWMNMVCIECKKSGDFIVNMKSLPEKFRRNGKDPQCIEEVIKEMIRKGKLVNIYKYNSPDQSKGGWMKWGYDQLVKKPISWGFSYVWRTNGNVDEDLYVYTDLLEEKCKKLMDLHYSEVMFETTDSIEEYSKLEAKCSDFVQSERELKIILRELERKYKVALVYMEVKKKRELLVKFAKQNESKVSPVTELDFNIQKLKNVEVMIEKDSDTLFFQIARLRSEAASLAKSGQRKEALRILRKKKMVERSLEKRQKTSLVITDLLQKIRDSYTDDMVLQAYEASTSALKTLQQDVNIERVDSTLDNLQQVMEDQEDINKSFQSLNTSLHDFDEDDLENELADVLNEKDVDDMVNDLSALSVNNKDLNLPDVPKYTPTKTSDPHMKLDCEQLTS